MSAEIAGNGGIKKRRGNPAWVKGVSGNPAGRRREDHPIRHLARQYTEASVRALVEALTDKNPMARIHAAEALLDRGWGKPQQAMEVEHVGGGPTAVIVEYIRRPQAAAS